MVGWIRPKFEENRLPERRFLPTKNNNTRSDNDPIVMATVLFVTTRIPYPPWEGHQIRTYNLLKSACALHEVHLLSFIRGDEDATHAEHLKEICTSVELVDIPGDHNRLLFALDLLKGVLSDKPGVVRKYFSLQMVDSLRRHLDIYAPDLVHLDMLPLAQYLPFCNGHPVVLNEHNVESLLLQRRSCTTRSPLFRSFFSNQAQKLQRFESWACRGADRILACSEDDAAILAEMGENGAVDVVANGVDCDYFVPKELPSHDRYNMVFVGGMGWFPNRGGMEFFLHRVMPLVCREIPEATITMVGQSDGLEIPTGLAGKVRLTGFVEDLRPWVQQAGIYVVPLRVGGGTRLKLLEAMAMAKPIVSTTIGAEGIAVEHGKHLLIADEAGQIAAEIIRLMSEPELASRIGQQARLLAVEKYDWKVVGNQLLRVYQTLLSRES